MAEAQEIGINIKVNIGDAAKKLESVSTSVQKFSRDIKSFGKDLAQVSRELTVFSGAITGAFSVAFATARKDIPAVNNEFLSLQNSMQAMAYSVANAALPSLQEFGAMMNNIAIAVGNFAENHGELLNQFLKYSAITLAVTTLGFAFGKLIKFLGEFLILFGKVGALFGATQPVMLAILGTILALTAAIVVLTDKSVSLFEKLKAFATSGFSGIGALFGKTEAGKSFTETLAELKKAFSQFNDDLNKENNSQAKRTLDVLGAFAEGFKSTIKDIQTAIKDFGSGVKQSFEGAFSDTIFNTITGKLKGLRSIITSLGNDIARAFSNFAANEILRRLFGSPGQSGALGSIPILGSLFGGKASGSNGMDAASKQTTRQFEDLTENMKKFGRAKDDVIDNLKKFGRTIDETSEKTKGLGGAAGAGALAGGTGLGSSLGINISGLDQFEVLNELMTTTVGMVSAIQSGFDGIASSIIKMGITYTVTQAAMLAVSVAASAAMVAIGTATASALAAVWIIPALFASIATLGAAAAIGTAAVISAMAAAPAIGIAGVQAGASITNAAPATEGFSNANAFNGPNNKTRLFDGVSLPAYADGGIVDRPTLALIGEAGPEAVVPLSGKNGSSPLRAGNRTLKVVIQQAVLNDPSNMRQFYRKLREELGRDA